jgi:tetratricopeptide (TPR) repeat protein
MELGRTDDALATLQALQKLDPLNDKIRTAIQQILNMKQSRQDVVQLEVNRANNPRDFGLLTQLAQAYSRAGQNDRIPPLLQSYLAQTNIAPDDILQAAQAFMNIGRVDDAIGTLQLMMQRFPQDARGYFAFALVRTAQNNAGEAIPLLEKAIELAPQLRKQATEDQRFNSLRNNPEFQKLIKPQ